MPQKNNDYWGLLYDHEYHLACTKIRVKKLTEEEDSRGDQGKVKKRGGERGGFTNINRFSQDRAPPSESGYLRHVSHALSRAREAGHVRLNRRGRGHVSEPSSQHEPARATTKPALITCLKRDPSFQWI